METLCSLYFALAMTLGCGGDTPPDPKPTPRPNVEAWSQDEEPNDDEKARTSTDGVSTWEWRYEQMCKCEFVRDPMTPEEIEEHHSEETGGDTEGRFIFIPNRP